MKKLKVLAIFIIVAIGVCLIIYNYFSAIEEGEGKFFEFYLPWDDSEGTFVSLSSLLDKPAGRFGFIHVGRDGHLYAGDKRIKFLGVNICGSAAFPKKEDAEKIAARLAKFGVNIVRFHHMDAPWESFNIFNRSAGGTRRLNEQALDRLDYFIAMLKNNGIYIDLNLLVSRQLSSADGLPTEIDIVSWKDQQVLGFFVEEIMSLHMEYARLLLTHYNPYTNSIYAQEPSIAVIEIVNEQGLLQGWLGGVIDNFPGSFKERLREKWNKYLLNKYSSTEVLMKTWGMTVKGRLEDGSVDIFMLNKFDDKTLSAKRDWIEFLWDLEEKYFKRMYKYLKEDLGVKSLIIGTITSCSAINIQAQLDIIDTHNYWHHPEFPGTPWDPVNWYVINKPMVNNPEGSTIPDLALRRVYGKPHFVTEYNHPAPNMYDAETVVTLAAYAALQDWDGIFLFDYGRLDNWDSRMIRGYFDVDQHPTKMATLIPAYLMFVRGDVNPSNGLIVAPINKKDEIDIIAERRTWAWRLIDGAHIGIQRSAPLVYRTALMVEGGPAPSGALMPQEINVQGPIYESDNKQVIWDVTKKDKGLIIVNSSRSLALIGFCGYEKYDFGNVIIEPGETILNGWAVITLNIMEGQNFKDWRSILLVAAGYTINNNARILEYASGRVLARGTVNLSRIDQYNGGITCRNMWGEAPTLTEGVSAKIKIKSNANVEVWALDNRGYRKQAVPVKDENGYKTFTIGLEYATLWYEISLSEE
ncbi:MAG: beta-galactosidase [Candidatus Bathyarchaeia archaeon]